MSTPPDDDRLREHVRRQMREKETAELIAIWQENDREAWTDDAFEAVREVLLERLGELPEQGLPENEDFLPEDDAEIEYPPDKKLIWIADWSARLSWVILGIAILFAILRLIRYFFVPFSPEYWAEMGIVNNIIFIIGLIDGVVYAGFAFIVLQAITEVIYLLIDLRTILQSEQDEESLKAEDDSE